MEKISRLRNLVDISRWTFLNIIYIILSKTKMIFHFIICINSCKMPLGILPFFFLDSFLQNAYLRWKQNSTAASCLYHNENKCIYPGNMELPCVQQLNLSSALYLNWMVFFFLVSIVDFENMYFVGL